VALGRRPGAAHGRRTADAVVAAVDGGTRRTGGVIRGADAAASSGALRAARAVRARPRGGALRARREVERARARLRGLELAGGRRQLEAGRAAADLARAVVV